MVQKRCLRIPLDCRLLTAVLWGTAIALAVLDTLDGDRPGFLSLWAIIVGMVAMSATAMVALTRSRRIMLEVMSYEHRQMSEPGPRGTQLTSVGD